jgi:hypothetical protein
MSGGDERPRYVCGSCGDPISTSSHSRHICYPAELIANLRCALDLAAAELSAHASRSPALFQIRTSIALADAALQRRQEITSGLARPEKKLP